MKNATKSVYLSAVASGCWLPMLLLLLLLEETDRGKRIESPTTEVFTFRLFTLLLSCGANDAREYKREQDSMLFTVVYCVWCTPHMYVRAICEYLQGRMGVILLYIWMYERGLVCIVIYWRVAAKKKNCSLAFRVLPTVDSNSSTRRYNGDRVEIFLCTHPLSDVSLMPWQRALERFYHWNINATNHYPLDAG